MQPETKVRTLRPTPETAGLVWVECPYPLLTLGLTQTLRAAGCAVRSGHKAMPVEKEEVPSCVVYCPNGEDVAQEVNRLQALFPDAPVLVLGFNSSNLSLARRALQTGARGFLHLGMRPEQIARALRLAIEGEVVVPRELVAGLVKGEEPSNLLALSARQREILELVAEGKSNAEIARQLFLAEGTVKQHLRAAYKLLGVRSRAQAAAIFRRNNQ